MGLNPYFVLPSIQINGSLGRKIIASNGDYTIDFVLNQRYNTSVISYNVIGQLNGTILDKTVIVSSLYDSWWCQGTADSAIGMAMVLGIAKYFVENDITPECTLKFIAFGGEEYGLLGAYHYEETHPNEYIEYVMDLNQLCMNQTDPRLALQLISNDQVFLSEAWSIAEQSNYVERMNESCDIEKVYEPTGAPANDRPFATANGRDTKTICFLKNGLSAPWILHHRDGLEHDEGDVFKYLDENDLTVTGEIVLNIVINFIEYQHPEGNQQNMQSNIQTTQNSFLNLIQSQINNAGILSANMGVAR